MRSDLGSASAAESLGSVLESDIRPIGEVMPLVLARYGAGCYQFYWCGEVLPQRGRQSTVHRTVCEVSLAEG